MPINVVVEHEDLDPEAALGVRRDRGAAWASFPGHPATERTCASRWEAGASRGNHNDTRLPDYRVDGASRRAFETGPPEAGGARGACLGLSEILEGRECARPPALAGLNEDGDGEGGQPRYRTTPVAQMR